MLQVSTSQSSRSYRLDRGRLSTVKNPFNKSNLSTFIPEHAPLELEQPSNPVFELRPKRAFRGKAFVSMANLITPLMGTKILPAAPKQEKLYYNVAMEGNIDHFDGEYDVTFADDIKAYMKPVLQSLHPVCQRRQSFLSRRDNKYFTQEWNEKFPLASIRIMEYNAVHTEPTDAEKEASDVNMSYDSEIQSPRVALMSGISASRGGVKTDEVETVDMAELRIRMAQTSLQNIFARVERPDAESDFQLRYQKYRNKIAHFNKMGEKWNRPHGFISKIRELKLLCSYNEFEAWILTEKPNAIELNWLHELFMASGVSRALLNRTQAVRIGHWITIFFQYTNFKNNRPMVS